MFNERKAWIRNRVFNQVIHALERDLKGGEAVMKECWEDMCDEAELEEADRVLSEIIDILYDHRSGRGKGV